MPAWRSEMASPAGVPQDDPARHQLDESIVLVEPGQRGMFEKRLAALNAKALAFGLTPITILGEERVAYRRTTDFADSGGEKLLLQLVPVRPGETCASPIALNRIHLQYPLIRLGSWSVVGKLEATEFGNVSFAVSQAPADLAAVRRYAEEPLACEHCHKKRQRLDGYILRDDATAQYKQVGSSCLQDFTGVDPAAALFLATMSKLIRLADEGLDEYARSGARNSLYTREFLADVAFLAAHWGFVSAAKAAERDIQATFATAAHMTAFLAEQPEFQPCYFDERERHLARADAIRQWFASKAAASDFERNTRLLLQSDLLSIDRKHLAVAAAAVAMHARHLDAEVQRRRPSVHVGVEGEKMSAPLTIERIVQWANSFAPQASTYLVLMRDDGGNRVAWRTGSAPADITDGLGRRMEASFKIKKHDSYNEAPQTLITHLKVVRWLDLQHAGRAPLPSTDRALDPADPTPTMTVSIYRHAPGPGRNYSEPVVLATEVDEAGLIQQAGLRGIRILPSGGQGALAPAPCFESGPDHEGATYSLHVHTVAGREPEADDYRYLATLLDAPVVVPQEQLTMP